MHPVFEAQGLGLGDEWAHVGGLRVGIAQLEGAHTGQEGVEQLRGHILVHQDALGEGRRGDRGRRGERAEGEEDLDRDAGLAVAREGADDEAVGDGAQVGVAVHNAGRVAAQLEQHLLLARLLPEGPADLG